MATILENRIITVSTLLQHLPQGMERLKELTMLNPIQHTPEPIDGVEQEVEDVGLLCMYTTDVTPSTRLQITFTDSLFNILPIPLADCLLYPTLDLDESKRTANLFANHPDPNVITIVTNLIATMQLEGFEVRTISYRELLTYKQADIDLSDIKGSFFPIIHFYNNETQETVFINVEPVL